MDEEWKKVVESTLEVHQEELEGIAPALEKLTKKTTDILIDIRDELDTKEVDLTPLEETQNEVRDILDESKGYLEDIADREYPKEIAVTNFPKTQRVEVINFPTPEITVQAPQVTVPAPQVNVEAPIVNIPLVKVERELERTVFKLSEISDKLVFTADPSFTDKNGLPVSNKVTLVDKDGNPIDVPSAIGWEGRGMLGGSGGFISTPQHQQALVTALLNISGSTVAQTFLVANSDRIRATVVNDSTAVLYIAESSTASSENFTWKLQQDDTLVVDDYIGILSGIWASAVGTARISMSA